MTVVLLFKCFALIAFWETIISLGNVLLYYNVYLLLEMVHRSCYLTCQALGSVTKFCFLVVLLDLCDLVIYRCMKHSIKFSQGSIPEIKLLFCH